MAKSGWESFHPDEENERQDIYLSIETKITSAERLKTILDLKMYPLP